MVSPTLYADVRTRHTLGIVDTETGERLVDIRDANHPDPWYRNTHRSGQLFVLVCETNIALYAAYRDDKTTILRESGARAARLGLGMYATGEGAGTSVDPV